LQLSSEENNDRIGLDPKLPPPLGSETFVTLRLGSKADRVN
jgi:hypothetical protein